MNKNNTKEGVNFVFEQNPELAKIGTPEQYSEYLDTIFPESKVKNIVWHISLNDFKDVGFSKEMFGKSKHLGTQKKLKVFSLVKIIPKPETFIRVNMNMLCNLM